MNHCTLKSSKLKVRSKSSGQKPGIPSCSTADSRAANMWPPKSPRTRLTKSVTPWRWSRHTTPAYSRKMPSRIFILESRPSSTGSTRATMSCSSGWKTMMTARSSSTTPTCSAVLWPRSRPETKSSKRTNSIWKAQRISSPSCRNQVHPYRGEERGNPTLLSFFYLKK